jgi:hypothetical protein
VRACLAHGSVELTDGTLLGDGRGRRGRAGTHVLFELAITAIQLVEKTISLGLEFDKALRVLAKVRDLAVQLVDLVSERCDLGRLALGDVGDVFVFVHCCIGQLFLEPTVLFRENSVFLPHLPDILLCLHTAGRALCQFGGA